MSAMPIFPFDESTPVEEPVEIRLHRRNRRPYVLVASRHPERGTVGYSLSVDNSGVPESLSSLQCDETFPGKAIPGWQREVCSAVASGLYTIEEVR